MGRIDLNIVDRGTNDTKWTAENEGLTAENLDAVVEQKTDNCSALNSLPTPFARFFVAKEAFRRVKEENLNHVKEAGYAYRQLVSDILDVYELLFNLKYHINNSWKKGETLELREWDAEENLPYLKNKLPILYKTLNTYYKTDINEEKLYFLVYTEEGKELLLATSSPLTGFVTPPDMDKSQVRDGVSNIVFADQTKDHESKYKRMHIRRKSGGEYFRDTKLFEDRSPDFKNYLYHELFGSESIDDRLMSIKSYIRSFKNDPDIRTDYQMRMKPILTDQNDALVINGLEIKSSDEIDINSYFTQSIIKLPYRISRDNYTAVTYQNDFKERDYDYLLPFKADVMALFDNNQIDTQLHINKNSVTVYLKYQGKTYEKEYAVDPFKHGQGTIRDLGAAKINFDLGLFPNILSSKESENNYFKVFVVAADEDKEAPNFNIDKINLKFFSKGSSIFEVEQQDTAQFGVLPAAVRSRQKTDTEDSGTKYYELFGTSFDAVEVEIMGETGLLFPKWLVAQETNDVYTYSIDLGTSNTFISRTKIGANESPQLFKMERPMVNYLHENPQDRQFSLTRQIENSVFKSAKTKIKTEFLPPFIDGTDYKFPIRTALCGVKGNTLRPKLFDDYSIAFFYEKWMQNNSQKVITDIKWEENNQDKQLRLFIRELLLIIKCDILQRSGDLDHTRIVWFRPLSFTGNTKNIYDDIWYGDNTGIKGEPENILFIQRNQIQCFSESEAPYYYFKKKAIIPDSNSVTVVDIGGGSTDFVYFEDNQPKAANSIHFGCDVLWDNGYVGFEDAKENGIYNRYASTIRFDREELNVLNQALQLDSDRKTKDIINFWLSNSSHCDIVKSLRDEYKPVFIYHLTSILFYMSYLYKEKNLQAPRSLVFSGNGSKYVDSFISTDHNVIKKIVDFVFGKVFGGIHDIHLIMPQERKESTCYGGLYRDPDAPIVPEIVYQGDTKHQYETVGEIIDNYPDLKEELIKKYELFNKMYNDVINLLKKENAIDPALNVNKYINAASKDMGTTLDTYFKTEVKEKYQSEVQLKNPIFFIPIIDRIFEMTKI